MGKNILTKELLLKSVEEWNAAREAYQDLKPDLSGADLNGAKLSGANLNGATLSMVNLIGATLSGVNLSEATLRWTNLNRSAMHGVDLSRATLSMVNLSEANLSEANLNEVNIYEANLSGADLSGTNLIEATIIGATFSKTMFVGAKLKGATLSGENLSGENLSEVDLSEVNLRWARLIDATISGADLRRANLNGVDLSGADLSYVDLSGANLSEANLTRVNFSRATIGTTTFGDVDLSSSIGLDTIRHRGPSTIGIDTIYKSHGNIPEAFLRGCGVPDNFIEYARSLTANGIEYYSCFISYSHRDQEYAQRLHNDLQASGVRCWFAPHDLPIGAKTRPAIDDAIRIHDKLLLILSENSVQSNWVEHEVEHALDLETERGKLVLFPVRLDDAVMDSKTGWASNVKRQRNIGDFTKWKEHDAYQKAFSRLLKDLKQ